MGSSGHTRHTCGHQLYWEHGEQQQGGRGVHREVPVVLEVVVLLLEVLEVVVSLLEVLEVVVSLLESFEWREHLKFLVLLP